MNMPWEQLELTVVYDITITRANDFTPVIVDGYVQQPTTSVINAKASVQPASGKEIKQLPEGDTLIDVYKLWSHTEIKDRDRITWNGRDFTVLKSMDWSIPSFKTGHYQAFMTGLDKSNAD